MNIKKNSILILLNFALCCTPAFSSNFEDGLYAFKSNNFKKAEQNFRLAVQSRPSNVTARYYYAVSLINNKKFNEGKLEYIKTVHTSPKSKEAYNAILGIQSLNEYRKQYAPVNKIVLKIHSNDAIVTVPNVIINDLYIRNFILDTGATYTSISKSLATKLGLNLNNAKTIQVATANGVISAPIVMLKSLEINGLSVQNLEVIVLDLNINKNNLAGLLGLSFIKQFKMTLDKKNGNLTLETP